MLTRLDWYILKEVFVTFIFCMLLFTVIAVAVDSSEKTDDFVKAGLTTARLLPGTMLVLCRLSGACCIRFCVHRRYFFYL
jgi:lipopolysaccharide export LptBFGC system permease protein LptF